jgi:ABC-type transport system involved in multi-copper enzyme maturation permease subunit
MIWLTWRQSRTQAVVALAALVALGITLAITGPRIADLYRTSGIPGCAPQDACDIAIANFTAALGDSTALLYILGLAVMYLTPAVIGLFWGAPLVAREFETGTYRLAWNQSVTPTRWLAVKLGLLGLAAMAVAGLFSLAISWWAAPIDQVHMDRIMPAVFGARGIVPIGYAAFAFALGVIIGTLLRRTVPAMAVTIALVAAAQVVTPLWIRPHLIPPVHTTIALTTSSVDGLTMNRDEDLITIYGTAKLPDMWALESKAVDAAGQEFTGPIPDGCRDSGPPACLKVLEAMDINQVVTYQPGSRFWPLQWLETGAYLALALFLAGLSIQVTRSRRRM